MLFLILICFAHFPGNDCNHRTRLRQYMCFSTQDAQQHAPNCFRTHVRNFLAQDGHQVSRTRNSPIDFHTGMNIHISMVSFVMSLTGLITENSAVNSSGSTGSCAPTSTSATNGTSLLRCALMDTSCSSVAGAVDLQHQSSYRISIYRLKSAPISTTSSALASC